MKVVLLASESEVKNSVYWKRVEGKIEIEIKSRLTQKSFNRRDRQHK